MPDALFLISSASLVLLAFAARSLWVNWIGLVPVLISVCYLWWQRVS